MAEKKDTTTTEKNSAAKAKPEKTTKVAKDLNLAEIRQAKQDYFRLKMEVFGGKEKDTTKLKTKRKEIARALTKLNQAKAS